MEIILAAFCLERKVVAFFRPVSRILLFLGSWVSSITLSSRVSALFQSAASRPVIILMREYIWSPPDWKLRAALETLESVASKRSTPYFWDTLLISPKTVRSALMREVPLRAWARLNLVVFSSPSRSRTLPVANCSKVMRLSWRLPVLQAAVSILPNLPKRPRTGSASLKAINSLKRTLAFSVPAIILPLSERSMIPSRTLS